MEGGEIMSSDQAKKYHSVNFGDKNTWDDWQLIPATRPVINPPEIIEQTEETDLGDGELVTTNYLLGEGPHFGLAEGEITFYMDNLETYKYEYLGWPVRRSEILAYLHNRRGRMVLDDDPDYYYEGRYFVSFANGKDYSTMTVKYKLDKYHLPIS